MSDKETYILKELNGARLARTFAENRLKIYRTQVGFAEPKEKWEGASDQEERQNVAETDTDVFCGPSPQNETQEADEALIEPDPHVHIPKGRPFAIVI